MIYYYYLCILVLLSSNIITIVLFYREKNKQKQRPESVELQEFLIDLLNGNSLIKVSRINSADILVRSPRGK